MQTSTESLIPISSNGSRGTDLRRLKVAGIVLPLLFVLALELIRAEAIVRTPAAYVPHALLAAASVVAVVAFALVIFRLIAVADRRARERERQVATLAERERIARELHDSLAQVLGATHLRLRALVAQEDSCDGETLGRRLSELADICEEGYLDARGAILDLHESSRVDLGLLDSLRRYLDKYSRQSGVEASLENSAERDLRLTPHSEIHIIKVIQEALTNVRKHSGATAATVSVSNANGMARFVVEDDGQGFDPLTVAADRDGFGLHAMRERMELIGGTLRTHSARGRGTRVVAEVPVPTNGNTRPERVELNASAC